MWIGILSLIGASLILGSVPTVNNYLLGIGLSSGVLVCYSYLTVAIVSGSILLLWKQTFKVSGKQLVLLLLLGGAMGGTGYLLNLSYELIPVGLATMLHFAYPSIVTVVMIILFCEKWNKFKVGAIVASIIGMALISDPSGGVQWLGIVFALCSSLTYAYYIIANDKGSINGLPLLVKLFYSSLVASAIFGIQSFHVLSLPKSGTVYFLLFGVCGIGSLIAFYLLTSGIKRIGATTASFFNMLEPITSLVVSSCVYQMIPAPKIICGCVLVVVSVLFVAAGDLKKNS